VIVAKKKAKKKKKLNLTVKQRKLVRGKMAGKTQTQAALDAGYTGSRKAVNERASLTMRLPHVQEFMQKALEKHDLTQDRIASELNRGLKYGELGKHDSYLKDLIKLHGAGKDTDTDNKSPLRIEVLLGMGDIKDGERTKFGEALVAVRISRGLHPSENRPLTEGEAEMYGRMGKL